jgi:hypothetical protein
MKTKILKEPGSQSFIIQALKYIPVILCNILLFSRRSTIQILHRKMSSQQGDPSSEDPMPEVPTSADDYDDIHQREALSFCLLIFTWLIHFVVMHKFLKTSATG